MSYPGDMTGVLKSGIKLIFMSALVSSCGLIYNHASPTDISEQFYSHQGDYQLPSELFIDEGAQRQVELLVSQRESMMGSYRSHKRVGSNRRMVLDGQGKKETVIFIFEVTYDGGRASETLTISRSRASEPYCITSYEIENISQSEDPTPVGTSST